MLPRIVLFVALLGFIKAHNELDEIVDEFWEWRMRNNPEFASNVGDQRYMDDVEDFSISAIDKRKVDMDAFMSRLNKLDRESMPSDQQVTYDILVDTIQTWLDGYEWKDYGPMNPINIMEGIHRSLGSKVGQVKFEKEEDFRKFAVRIGKIAGQVLQIIERMRRAVAKNTTNPISSIEGVPEQIQTDVLDKYNNNMTAIPIYSPYVDTIDQLVTNQTAKQEIRSLAQEGVRSLLNNLATLKTFLTNEYIPNVRTSFGVWSLPRGLDYYAACLKWQLSVNLTADEIYDLGISEVNRVHGELEKIVKKAGFDGTVKEYNDYLRNKSDLFIDDGDEALARFKSFYKDRIVPKLHLMFRDIPDVPLLIEKMANDGANGIYKNGAPDGSRPGVFYANVHHPVPTFDMAALLVHETDPGHHLQDSYALTSRNIPMFRKATDFSKYFAVPLHFPFYTAYSEGWGLYSEDLGDQLHIYQDDLERFGKLGLEIFRAARLVVDTGIHAKRWSQQKAIDYMSNYTAYKLNFITREVKRYAGWPAQATSYTIGKLKIIQLREYAFNRLCAFFNIKDFHHIILSNGAMPLSVMEKLIKEWVDKVREDNNLTGNDCSHTWANGADPVHGTSLVLALTLLVARQLF